MFRTLSLADALAVCSDMRARDWQCVRAICGDLSAEDFGAFLNPIFNKSGLEIHADPSGRGPSERTIASTIASGSSMRPMPTSPQA